MTMDAYCVVCKTKREMLDPRPIYTASGRPASEGVCPVCGTKLVRMSRTSAHDSLPQPGVVRPISGAAGKKSAKIRKAKSSRKTKDSAKEKLVIVESPAKARTLSRYLGSGYRVKASLGHVRDLLRSSLSVDVENDFTPKYTIPREKRSVVKELKEAAKKAKAVYLATDPDREGEAIAWHLIQAVGLNKTPVHRVAFFEITPQAVAAAFKKPRYIDPRLVDAQQARRVLDRLVGYKLSPLLWAKVRNRLSAGRVQSVALRLVVEREREIENFVPQEFWTIDAELAPEKARGQKKRPSFLARLIEIRGEKAQIGNETEAQKIGGELQASSFLVKKVEKGEKKRRPYPPFITSTLQQDAHRRLRFSARRTMRIAQELYEGADLGPEGSVGLITYMRTDSPQVAPSAQAQARAYIAQAFGNEYLPAHPPHYKARTPRAQEAHEAIRPTSVFREPEKIKGYLTKDQYRLYDLIWRRFLASQMEASRYHTTTVDVVAGIPEKEMPYLLRATSAVLVFPGFLAMYENGEEQEGKPLPELTPQERLDLLKITPEQHFTQPPPRYSEASLIKALEEEGIGRPSTYAPIVSTIQQRGYVEQRERRLYPTSLGRIVNDLLVQYFPEVVDVGFTAQMEESLDKIASGEVEWVPVIREFYEPFEKDLRRAQEEIGQVELEEETTDEICDVCGNPMVVKNGRYGKFLACSTYPQCTNTKPYRQKIGVTCPLDGGQIVVLRTRRGRTFYGCSNYPKCEFRSWDRPLAQPCPVCGGMLVAHSRNYGRCLNCGSKVPLEAEKVASVVEAGSSSSG